MSARFKSTRLAQAKEIWGTRYGFKIENDFKADSNSLKITNLKQSFTKTCGHNSSYLIAKKKTDSH